MQQFVDRRIPCADVDGLLLTKIFALPSLYRQGRFGRVELYERDVTMLIRRYDPDRNAIFRELSQHLSESDLREVRGIVEEIEDRIERSEKRFKQGE